MEGTPCKQAKLGKALIIAIFGLTIPFVNPVGEREISPTLHPEQVDLAHSTKVAAAASLPRTLYGTYGDGVLRGLLLTMRMA